MTCASNLSSTSPNTAPSHKHTREASASITLPTNVRGTAPGKAK